MNIESLTKKIKTIKVKRTVEREVTVLRKFEEDVDVFLTDLTEPDLDSIKDADLIRAVAIGFMKLYNEFRDISLEQGEVIKQSIPPEPTPIPLAPTEETITAKRGSNKSKQKEAVTDDPYESTKGIKVGKSSKYHYTYFDSTYKCWKTNDERRSYKDEVLAALGADTYLDRIGDEKRPRNRDNFPEIMEAYLL